MSKMFHYFFKYFKYLVKSGYFSPFSTFSSRRALTPGRVQKKAASVEAALKGIGLFQDSRISLLQVPCSRPW